MDRIIADGSTIKDAKLEGNANGYHTHWAVRITEGGLDPEDIVLIKFDTETEARAGFELAKTLIGGAHNRGELIATLEPPFEDEAKAFSQRAADAEGFRITLDVLLGKGVSIDPKTVGHALAVVLHADDVEESPYEALPIDSPLLISVFAAEAIERQA